jgi:phage/plasmid-associated DNA primase
VTENSSRYQGEQINRPESFASGPSVNSQNDVSTGVGAPVNLDGESVNSNTGMTRSDADKRGIPLVRSGAPGARGWMSGDGTFLIGPYAGKRMLDWALDYAVLGWHVFQMRTGTKSFYGNCPRCKPEHDQYDADAHASGSGHCGIHPDGYSRCHGLWSATRDPEVIKHWWTENPHGNIGINCGLSGIACVDVDIKHHQGKYGDRSVAALEEKHGALPIGPRATTASGGWHWVFRLPEDHELRSSTGYTDAKGRKHGLGDHVDIKAVGGLMVAAPSLVFDDKTGQVTGQYTWDDNAGGEIPELPGWVMAEIADREQRTIAVPSPFTAPSFSGNGAADRNEVLDRVNELADEVARTPAGGRNEQLLRNAKWAFQYAEAGQVSHNEVQFIFEQAAVASGMDQSDFHTIANARNYAKGKPYTYMKKYGAAEAQQTYDAWKNVPAPRQEDAPQVPEAGDPDTPAPHPLVTYEDHVEAFGINSPSYKTALEIVYEHKPDQMGISELFTHQMKGGDHLRWNDESGKFYSYAEGHWNEDGDKHTAVARKVDMLGKRVTLLVDNDILDLRARIKGIKKGEIELSAGLSKDDAVKMLEELIKIRPNWYKTYRSAGGRAGIVEFIKTAVDTVRAEDMDADPCLMNFANGTYDVRTGQLRPHNPADYVTHRIKHSLNPDLAEKPLEEVAPLFAKVLKRACAAPGEVPDDILDNRVEALKRGIGSTLHGSNPEKKMLVLKGASNTGKTVAMNTVRALIGSQLATESRPNLLIRTRNDRHESEEYKLKGRRLVLINELETKMSMDEGQVLRLVNPDNSKFTVRKLREQQQDINVTWSLVVTTNELLKARVTQQVLNRLCLYVLSNISVPHDEIDTTLGDRIMQQEAEAILAHMVMWWAEWYHTKQGHGSGLIITDEMRMALAGFEEDNSSLADQFRDEMVVFGKDYESAQIRVNDLWSRYVSWHQVYHPNEELRYGVNRKQFYAEVLGWTGVTGVYKKNGTRPDGTPKQTLIGFQGMGVLISPHGDTAKTDM